MKRWRLGLIGCGWAGERHALAMGTMPERAELCALADVEVEKAEALAREWPAAILTAHYEKLLTKDLLDAVSICLPHQLHARAAIAAAEAGLHVLVEKPLATTLAEADAMIAAADSAGVQLMVAENVRFDATYARVAELIKSGTLGEPFLLRISREHQMHDYLRQRPWFLNEPSAGIMYSGGIHDFELLRMLGGELEHLYGLVGPKALPDMAGDDNSAALVGLRSGATGLILESFSLRTPTPGVHGTAHGNRGSLWFHQNRIQLYAAPQDGCQDLVDEIVVSPRDTFQAEITHFVDCLDSGTEPITSGREERKPLVAVLATYESIQRGERVDLKEFDQE